MVGDRTIGMSTFSTTPVVQCTTLPDARPAPTRPPIRACEEEDGSPKYHVMKFHAIAPTRAARTTVMPAGPAGGSMIDFAIVTATPVDNSAPPRFAIAAMIKAIRGVRARVEIALAIAFAAS